LALILGWRRRQVNEEKKEEKKEKKKEKKFAASYPTDIAFTRHFK
jgi:hypothetical protein